MLLDTGSFAPFADGFYHAIAHLWSTDLPGARKLYMEWEARAWPVQAVYSLLQQRCAPKILVDRGTENARSLDALRRAPSMFADLRVLHLCRHPYSVLSSGGALLRRTALARRIVTAADVASEGTPFEAALFEYVDATYAATHSNMLTWSEELEAARAASPRSKPPSPPHRLKFEDLVEAPEATLRAACAALGLPFDCAMLSPYDQPSNVALHSAAGEAGVAARDPKLMSHSQIGGCGNGSGKWRSAVPARQLSPLCSNVARALGYELRPPRPSSLAAATKPSVLVDGSLLELLNSGRAAAGAPAVFIAPGSDGELLPFVRLGDSLDGACPLFGLRLTPDVPRDSIRHAAAAYVAPIMAALDERGAANGTAAGCVIAGMSSGGCLAYELADVLSDAGVLVLGVMSIDRNPYEARAPLYHHSAAADSTRGDAAPGKIANGGKASTGDTRERRLAALDRRLESRGEKLSVEALLAALTGPEEANACSGNACNGNDASDGNASNGNDASDGNDASNGNACNNGNAYGGEHAVDGQTSHGHAVNGHAGSGPDHGGPEADVAALERFAHRYVASHSLIHAYQPKTPLPELLAKCGRSAGGGAAGAAYPPAQLTLFKAEATPQTALREGMRQQEIGGCDHYTVLQSPSFLRAFREACVCCTAPCV